MTEFLAKTQDRRSLIPGGEGQPTDRTPLQVGREPLATPDLRPLGKPANVLAMTTTSEAPINVQDLHIVVAALGGKTNKAFIGYTAVSAPMSYNEALKVWGERERQRSEHSRRRGSHVLNYAVRSVADPRFAPLVGRGYADAITRQGYKGDERGSRKAARAWAKLYGYKGAGGGWIYGPNFGKPVCQGWDSLADMLRRKGSIAQGADGLWYVLDREMVA